MPCRYDGHQPLYRVGDQQADLFDDPVPGRAAPQMDDDLEGGGHLGVQRLPGHPAEEPERLQPGRYVPWRVRVERAGAAFVPGVQRPEQVDDLGTPALPDHQPVRAHPQRLPDQRTQRDLTGTLHIGRTGLECHHVGVLGP